MRGCWVSSLLASSRCCVVTIQFSAHRAVVRIVVFRCSLRTNPGHHQSGSAQFWRHFRGDGARWSDVCGNRPWLNVGGAWTQVMPKVGHAESPSPRSRRKPVTPVTPEAGHAGHAGSLSHNTHLHPHAQIFNSPSLSAKGNQADGVGGWFLT